MCYVCVLCMPFEHEEDDDMGLIYNAEEVQLGAEQVYHRYRILINVFAAKLLTAHSRV